MLTVIASDLPRLMTCNGSRLMGGATPPVNTETTVRDEGIAAHWLVQQVTNGLISAEELIDRKAPNGVYITAEMVEHVEEYMNDIMSGPDNTIECDLSYSFQNRWAVNGRADNVEYIYNSQKLIVRDLKYGWSIVEPEMNWTLISHAIGFILRNPEKIVLNIDFMIYQPRAHHYLGRVRKWSISRDQFSGLVQCIDNTLSNPNDILQTSAHCRNCPALVVCPAARAAQMNAIDASEKVYIDTIDNVNLSYQLDHLKRAGDMIEQLQKAYSELALHRVKEGAIIENYSIESELTNPEWLEHITPEYLQMMTGKDLTKKKLITPTQAKKAGLDENLVKTMTGRRNKGVKLVRITAQEKAKKLFEVKK